MAEDWFQRIVKLAPRRRGVHLVTAEILEKIPEIVRLRVGILHLFIQHTSASITINENADPDVQHDFEASLNALVPENFSYVHTLEGPDDMPAHVKASLLGAALTIPIANGQLLLGTWQGIYLCEHRNHGDPRSLVITAHGQVG
ncbi:MAG: secondary thiamine-phosphate synthase enzyme YjbQ [Planctomycetota bacterium]